MLIYELLYIENHIMYHKTIRERLESSHISIPLFYFKI